MKFALFNLGFYSLLTGSLWYGTHQDSAVLVLLSIWMTWAMAVLVIVAVRFGEEEDWRKTSTNPIRRWTAFALSVGHLTCLLYLGWVFTALAFTIAIAACQSRISTVLKEGRR